MSLSRLLQMRPTRTTLLDHSTISCPGNKAVSSSDSKRTCFGPSVTAFSPESKLERIVLKWQDDERLLVTFLSVAAPLFVSDVQLL